MAPLNRKQYKKMVTRSKSMTPVQRMRKMVWSKNNGAFLRALADPETTKKMRCCLVDGMTDSQVNVIRCICKNFISRNIPVKNSRLQELRKHKTAIMNLADPNSHCNPREVVKQKGGFLPLLLPLLGPVAGALTGGILKAAGIGK